MASGLSKFVGRLLCDVIVTVTLFLLGIGLASWLRLQCNPNQEWMYSVWLTFATVPMLLYINYRCESEVDIWDIFAALRMLITIGLVNSFLGDQFIAPTVLLMFPFTGRLKRFLSSAKPSARARKVMNRGVY